MLPETVVVLLSPSFEMPRAILPAVLMLPADGGLVVVAIVVNAVCVITCTCRNAASLCNCYSVSIINVVRR